ncbi:hypothetical protein B4U80_13213 [Leptotrombidium deliense]|uniref:Uncharacterized protein n=1 Tax=Leptotrombidium deliense TaxID=299467 RepID=A0A443SAI4_9ACAR|nr:hypothetical protein B4U80_13213 [Leptotrombidium deliense]
MAKSYNVKHCLIFGFCTAFLGLYLLSNAFHTKHYLNFDLEEIFKQTEQNENDVNGVPKDVPLDALYKLVNKLNVGPKFESEQYCNIPLYIDANDKAAKEFMIKERLNCPIQHSYTFVDDNGFLRKNSSKNETYCTYRFLRRKAHDQENSYSPEFYLSEHGMQIPDNDPFLRVNCYESKSKKLIYTNTHLKVPSFKSKSSANTPSVIVLVVESLSVLSYHRYLLKTQEAINRMGGMQVLKGLTKIGRNSFPNSFGFLVGKAMKDEDCAHIKHWDNKFEYIWDDFKKAGYVTAFAEDMAQAGLFTYYSTGFVKKPTDWYPTPFWINMYPQKKKNWSKIWKDWIEYCYEKTGPKIDIFLDQVFRFHRKLRSENSTYFMYAFYSQSCHEDFNMFQYVDDSLAKFIDRIRDNLNDTILIMMGDHGIMHGDYTETPLGHMEGSLPYFGIRVPEVLDKKYPHLREYLSKNSERLLSWWDIRKMVLDISKNIFEIEDTVNSTEKYLSPWRQTVPLSRSCTDAGVDDQWCVCNGVLGEMPKMENYYKKLEKLAIDALNSKLSGYSCPKFSVGKTLRINVSTYVQNMFIYVNDIDYKKIYSNFIHSTFCHDVMSRLH